MTAWKKEATVFWIALVFLYPVIGWPLGHVYPKVLLPVFPCPLTVFAIALVAAAAPNADKKVFILLLPWALMALPKCFGALDCYEDCILFASGVYGLVELIRNWKALGMGTRREPLVQECATDQEGVARRPHESKAIRHLQPIPLGAQRGGSRHPTRIRHRLLPATAAGCNRNLTLYALRPIINRTDADVGSGPWIKEGHYGARHTARAPWGAEQREPGQARLHPTGVPDAA